MTVTAKLIPSSLRSVGRKLLRAVHSDGGGQTTAPAPEDSFHSHIYLRHNQRRQEHLASLALPIAGASVLEVAAGIGDHTTFFLDRGCTVVSTEGRAENLAVLRQRYPALDVRHMDLDNPVDLGLKFDIVYCYGTLYHLRRPAEALGFIAGCCRKMLLLETCVSFGDHEAINPVEECAPNPTQSIVGLGCRPTRPWVYRQLRQHFEHVYIPRTQPNHEEFPLDWTTAPPPPNVLTRSVFIATRQPLDNTLLTEELLLQQIRQG